MAAESILVVDDTPLSLKLAQILLQAAGYQVQIACGAAEALEVLSHSHPTLILMDIQMPDMDGLELTRILRRDPALNGVRIIALSARDSDEDVEAALTAGCQGYIKKPISPATFAGLVRGHVDPNRGVG